MTMNNHDSGFPEDAWDRWIQRQLPPDPSPTFLDRCLATILPSDETTADRSHALMSTCVKKFTRKGGSNMKRRLQILGVSSALCAAMVLVLVGSFWFTQTAEAQKAVEVLSRGVDMAARLSTIHLVAKMRTSPGDDFDSIDADVAMAPVQVWRQFGDHSKWRIEKPGLTGVMDDACITFFVPPDYAWRQVRPKNGNANCCIFLLDMSDVRGLLQRELDAAMANRWNLRLVRETTASGEERLCVTIEADYRWPKGNHAQDKFLAASRIRRVYRFDAKTNRLVGMDAYLQGDSGNVERILTVERIDYDEPIDQTRFELRLPKNVHLTDWRKEYREPEVLPDNAKYEKMSPKDAARAFFEACAKEDWDEVQKFKTSILTEEFKRRYGGLEIVRLGEPFRRAKVYCGWYVPYEIRLKSGAIKKWNLALKNNNQAKRYIEDGGL